MRSCAAMLTVQREFRRHCPAEASQEQMQMVRSGRTDAVKRQSGGLDGMQVDMLPILDLSDTWLRPAHSCCHSSFACQKQLRTSKPLLGGENFGSCATNGASSITCAFELSPNFGWLWQALQNVFVWTAWPASPDA